MGTHIFQHLRINAFGCNTHRQFAKCGQISLAEEMPERAPHLIDDINLAIAQSLQKIIRRQIDQFNFIGFFKETVGRVSRTRTREIRATISFRLSRCWMFSVV